MMKRYLYTLFMAIAALYALAMPQNTDTKMTETPNGTKVLMHTSAGDVTILLYDDTPKHRDNFLKLAGEGFYDGVLFHRVIKDFMVQAGDPDSRNAAPGARLGAGDPNYTIEAEIDYPNHYHKRGALAAARTPDQVNPEKRSSGSQFYIVTGKKYNPSHLEQMDKAKLNRALQDTFRRLAMEQNDTIKALMKAGEKEKLEELRQSLIAKAEAEVKYEPMPEHIRQAYIEQGGTPSLDGDYTVFGEVLDGMDVVAKIEEAETDAADRPKEDIKITSIEILK